MHEVAIAREIMRIVNEHADGAQPADIGLVRVRVGESAGIVPSSLQFGFQVLAAETMMDAAELVIETDPFRIRCFSCGQESARGDGLAICDHCGGTSTGVLSGTGLEVISIEIRENMHEYHHH